MAESIVYFGGHAPVLRARAAPRGLGPAAASTPSARLSRVPVLPLWRGRHVGAVGSLPFPRAASGSMPPFSARPGWPLLVPELHREASRTSMCAVGGRGSPPAGARACGVAPGVVERACRLRASPAERVAGVLSFAGPVAAMGAWEKGVSQGRCPGLRPHVSLLALAQRPVSCWGRLPEVRPRPRVSVSACLSRGVASWWRVPCGLVRTALRITSSLWIVPFGVEKRLCPVGPGSAVPDQDPGPCCSHQPGAPLSPRRSSPAGSPW